MSEITTIGLDLAKNVFQVHGIDEAGGIVLRKRLRRGRILRFFANLPPGLIGMEACATAHYWARELKARELKALGHEVRLMPPQYVKAYPKRNKNDAADAEAICEAVRRPTMRFVPLKTKEQQSALLMHRGRELLIRQRTMLVNALRGHLAEFGLVAAQGLHKAAESIAIVRNKDDERVPDMARQVLLVIADGIGALDEQLATIEARIMAWHRSKPVSRRLATIPGIGPVIATAITATVTKPGEFQSGREFAAWLGLAPRQNSTGGKARLGGISKRGVLSIDGGSGLTCQITAQPHACEDMKCDGEIGRPADREKPAVSQGTMIPTIGAVTPDSVKQRLTESALDPRPVTSSL